MPSEIPKAAHLAGAPCLKEARSPSRARKALEPCMELLSALWLASVDQAQYGKLTIFPARADPLLTVLGPPEAQNLTETLCQVKRASVGCTLQKSLLELINPEHALPSLGVRLSTVAFGLEG